VSISNVINATGSGSISITAPKQITVAQSMSTDSGDVSLSANTQLVATSGTFVGINVGNVVVQSNTGKVNLQGRGGDGAGGSQYGVLVNGTLESGTNSITVSGTGG